MAFTPRNVVSDISIQAPDFSLMAKSAQAVQSRYLDGFNKAKSYYNSLLNADITSADNDKYRAEYFKKVNTYLTNLSGVDFSNPANVKAATDLFQPLVKDKDFVTDLTWTSMQNAEKSKMEEVRTNKDEKIRAQYDPIMQRAMDYSYEDMKNAKRGDGSISKVGVQKFVPFQNIQKALDQAASDLKLNVSTDHITGLYKITDKNGDDAYPAFLQWARQQMGTNFDEQLLVTGKVKTRQQIDNLMQGNPNLSKEDAYQQVAKDNSLGVYKNFNEYKNSLDQGISSIDKKIDEIKSKSNGKVAKNSPDFQTIVQLKQLKKQYQTELSGLDQSKNQDIQTAFDQYMANPEYAMMPVLKDNIAKGWAQGYVETHHERKIEADAVGLQLQREKFDQMMEGIKQTNRENLALKQHNWNMIEDANKAQLAYEVKKRLLKETGQYPSLVPTAPEKAGNKDLWDLAAEDKTKLQENVQKSYLDQSSIEIATYSTDLNKTFGASYVDISRALKNVIDNWDVYGSNPAADPTFFRDYSLSLKIAKRINPGITQIKNPGELFLLIEQGVKNYKGGNPTKAKQVRDQLSNAQDDLDELTKRINDEKQLMINLIKNDGGYYNKKYLIQNPDGTYSPNIANLNEDERADLAKKLIPNYQKYENKTAEQVTGFRFSGIDESKFDFGLIDDITKSAKYITDNPNDTDLSEDQAAALKKKIAGAGGLMSEKFGANGITATYWNEHGQEYAKITIPVKEDKKTGGKKVDFTNSGGLTFLVPKKDALNIASTSPLFAEMMQKIFTKSEPVEWLDQGLKTKGEVNFPPGYAMRYGIQGGSVAFDAIKNNLHVTIQTAPGETPQSVDTKINMSDYIADPAYITKLVDKTIREQLEKYSGDKLSSMQQAEESNKLAMMTNPNNYIDVDDIDELIASMDNNQANTTDQEEES